MKHAGYKRIVTDSSFVTYNAKYQAQRCEDHPLRSLCFKAKGDRIIEVNHQLEAYKQKARELLTFPKGIKHRGRRGIEPEAVFGQMKFNKAYKRFRHFGIDKIRMDFTFFAIALNIAKMCKKLTTKEIRSLIASFRDAFLSIFSLYERLIMPKSNFTLKNAA